MSVPEHAAASRAALTRAWADALSTTTYVPLSDDQIIYVLVSLLDRLIEPLTRPTFCSHAAAEVGAQLVRYGFVGERSLGATVATLTQALTAHEELGSVAELPAKVASLLGELASGYATALRRRTLDQQEEVKSALIRTIRESEARFQEVFSSTPVGIAVSQLTGPLTEANEALSDILGYPTAELTGRCVRELFHPDDAESLVAAYQDLVDGRRSRFQTRAKLLAANGDPTWASLAVSLLRDANGTPTHHVTMVEDVTDVHLLEERLRHQTLHDLLTGLPNQEYFWIHLKAVLEGAERGATVTLCKIDLDGFAVINDGHGHNAGNLVLGWVATRLQALVAQEHAMVARFGADEFVILIEDSPTSPDLATLAKDINSQLSEPVYLGDYGLAVSAGIGLVRRPAHGITAVELVRAADTTLHRAKRIGRGQWGVHDPPADAAEHARYALATTMPAAWESGQVTLCYQPLIRLDPNAADTDQIVATQALLRWEHAEHGVVDPEECVALAEQTGLVLSLGPWMLQQACQQLRSWKDQFGASVPPLRVDLTTHLAQDPDLVAVLHNALHESGLGVQDVQIGIPVELIVGGHGAAEDNLRTLDEMRVWTVLTRYGQAVGNLTTLESGLVRAVDLADYLARPTTQQPETLIRQALSILVPLIRRTGTAVVVAGVDNAEQAEWWRHIGAESARGAVFGQPCQPAEMAHQLAR